MLEGALYSEPGQVTQGLSGVIRLGVADEDVNQIGYYAGGVLVYTGLFEGRDEDVLGLGVSAAFNGGRFKGAQQIGRPGRRTATLMQPFGEQLNQTEIWQLVAYVRTLAEHAGGAGDGQAE